MDRKALIIQYLPKLTIMKLEVTIKSTNLNPMTRMIIFKFVHILTIFISALLLIIAVSILRDYNYFLDVSVLTCRYGYRLEMDSWSYDINNTL